MDVNLFDNLLFVYVLFAYVVIFVEIQTLLYLERKEISKLIDDFSF